MCGTAQDVSQGGGHLSGPHSSMLLADFHTQAKLGGGIPPLHICRGEPSVVSVAWIVRLDL